MSKKLNLPNNRWYTELLKIVINTEQLRRNLDWRDSYRFRDTLATLEDQLKKLLPIFKDIGNVPMDHRNIIHQEINKLFNHGRWGKEWYELKNEIVGLYELPISDE